MAMGVPDEDALINEQATQDKVAQIQSKKACKRLRLSSNDKTDVLVTCRKSLSEKTRKDVLDRTHEFGREWSDPCC